MPRNTGRQPKAVFRAARGAAAKKVPRPPVAMKMDTRRAYIPARNQLLMILKEAVVTTAMPTPTRARPASAVPRLAAEAKRSPPTPPIPKSRSMVRRGPQLSTSSPAGICVAA